MPLNDENEPDEIFTKINESNEKRFAPLVEDIAEWIAKFLSEEITAANFLDTLDNGVLICHLAQKLSSLVEQRKVSRGVKGPLKSLPKFEFNVHENAKKESFFARENAESFLKWCKVVGLKDSTLFVSEGLVLHKQLKNVVLTLLELGRLASRLGAQEIPGLVNLEEEIDDEENDSSTSKRNVTIRKKKKKTQKPLDLDAQVKQCARKYDVHIEKLKEGKYIVNGKNTFFVRMLRNHIMVRVGGGWDELYNFISRHSVINKPILVSTTTQGKYIV